MNENTKIIPMPNIVSYRCCIEAISNTTDLELKYMNKMIWGILSGLFMIFGYFFKTSYKKFDVLEMIVFSCISVVALIFWLKFVTDCLKIKIKQIKSEKIIKNIIKQHPELLRDSNIYIEELFFAQQAFQYFKFMNLYTISLMLTMLFFPIFIHGNYLLIFKHFSKSFFIPLNIVSSIGLYFLIFGILKWIKINR